MKKTTLSLPIFPLPIFLLPGGVTKLRIFEPRYLKMVAVASSGDGFVICLTDEKLNREQMDGDLQWGSWVEIVNFDQGEDGILEIEVNCKSLVNINTITVDENNLHNGEVMHTEHWSQNRSGNNLGELSDSLAMVFEENNRLSDLYQQKSLSDQHWVLARWLEILPIDINVKNAFVVKHGFQEAKAFVESVISKEH